MTEVIVPLTQIFVSPEGEDALGCKTRPGVQHPDGFPGKKEDRPGRPSGCAAATSGPSA